MALAAGAYTDVGTRKNINQDAFGLRIVSNGLDESAIAIVCDGVGGMSEGEIASSVVVCAFLDWFQASMSQLMTGGLTEADIFRQWGEITNKANLGLLDYAGAKGTSIGTTATVLLLAQGRAYAMNIGDTRLYHMAAKQLRQVTRDHTLVQQEVERGLLTPEAARHDRRKNVLIRCIGAEAGAKPDYYSSAQVPDSVYLLCTDGFRNVLEEKELCQALQPRRFPCREDLEEQLRNLGETVKSRGERDNITAVTIRMGKQNAAMEDTIDLESTIRLLCKRERIQPEAEELWGRINQP